MSNEINLLPYKRKNNYRYKKTFQIFQIISVFSLFLVVVSAILVFYLKSQLSLSDLRTQENNLIADISRLRNKKARLALVSDRIQNITEVLNSRPDYEKRLTTLLEQAPNDVSVSNLSLDNRVISFTASSTSLSSIGTFMDNLVGMVSKKEMFSKITLQYLSTGSSYNIAIIANLL